MNWCYFAVQHLAPPDSSATKTSSISAPLNAAIKSSFGTVDNMTSELTTAATKVFGSGWAWLCYTGGQPEGPWMQSCMHALGDSL